MTEPNHVSQPRFTPTVSLGNVIQIASMLVLLGAAYSNLTAEDRILAGRIEDLKAQRAEDNMRSDARFVEILAALRRIEGRLDEKADKR